MARQYVLSERDYQRMQSAVRWFERNKNSRDLLRRRNITIGGGANIKIYEVQSTATGDGVYTCREEKLLNAEWGDTAGDDKFNEKNTDEVEILNLNENDPETAGQHNLEADVLLAAWQMADDNGTSRWVGIPLAESAMQRSVKIQVGGVPANNTGPFTCKLLDSDGNEIGDSISVYPREHLGANNFNSGDVHPSYAAGDYMTVFKDLDGKWYTQDVFEDTIDCVCTSP